MLNLFSNFRILTIFVLSLSVIAESTTIYAKPDLSPLGQNIADQGSKYYTFQSKVFESDGPHHRYKVWLGIAKNADRTKPQAAIYLLDGNAVMDRLKDDLLKQLSEQDAPILVAIGYDSKLPFESKLRSLDYTPADETGKPSIDPRNPDRMSGGSQIFRQFILNTLDPWIASQVQIDKNRKALWGHSYGGLFVIDSFLNSHAFSHYFAASPSLTWADQRILNNAEKVSPTQVNGQNLMLFEGDLNLKNHEKISPNSDLKMIENNRKLSLILQEKGANTRLLIYPNLSHGQVFQASLLDVLNHRWF